MMLIEIKGPDPRIPNQNVVYWRTWIESGGEIQRAASNRLRSVLPDGWTVVFRPLGSLDAIVETLRTKT